MERLTFQLEEGKVKQRQWGLTWLPNVKVLQENGTSNKKGIKEGLMEALKSSEHV